MKKFFAKNLIVKANWNGSSIKFVSRLFLCSREIANGDKVLYFDLKGNTTNEEHTVEGVLSSTGYIATDKTKDWTDLYCPPERFGKIIGPISEEALWVKDGDEFDENEVKVIYKNQYQCLCEKPNVYRTPEQANCEHMRDDYRGGDFCDRMIEVVDYVKALCPSCKKFH